MIARVRGVTDTDVWAKAGVMMRETLNAGSRHASVFVTPGSGVAFQRRTAQNGSSTSTAGSASRAPMWLKMERAGSTFSAYESSDGVSWTLIGRDTLSVGSTLYVGVAVTSHNPGALTTATVSDVAVTTPLANEWTYADVGSPTPAGAAASSGSSFAVAAGGNDVWATSDQFGFLYRQVSGDADIVARVSDLQAAHTWSKAGLMIRDSLSANSSHAFALASGSSGLAVQTRPQTDSSSSQVGSRPGAAPVWMKLERRGGTITAYTSDDGARWTNFGTASVTMADPVFIGMAVTSHNKSQLASAVFSSVTVRELSAAGNVKPTVTMTSPSSGAVFESAPASVTLTATASDPDGSIGWVEFYSGTTLLGSDSSAPFTTQWDGVAEGQHSVTAVAFDNRGESATSAPVTFTVNSDSGGLVEAAARPGALPSGWTTSDVGSPALTGAASYANGTYTLQGAGWDIWDASDQFRFAYRTVTGDVDVVARVTGITNTDPWAKAGLMFRGALTGGSVNAMVYASPGAGVSFQRRLVASNQTTPINQTGGAPIWLKLSRRGQLVQAYRSTDGVNWTQMTSEAINLPVTMYVGLAVTSHNESAIATGTFTNVTVTPVAANQAPSVSLTAPANGSSYTAGANVTVSASASDADGTISKVDFYANSTLIGSDTSSPYSVTWSNAPAGAFTLSAVATDNAGATTTSGGRSVTIAAASGGGGTTPGALPSGWTTADVGSPALAGSASHANGTYSLQGAGWDIWDTSDQFRFAYRTVTGDVDVIAKVTGITNTDPWAKAGLMFRGAMTAGSVNAMVYASPGAGVSFQRRVVASDMTTPINQSGASPIWLKLSRRGQVVQAYRSTDGVNWTQMTSETINLPSTYYVGLAVTSHNESAVATGTFTDVTVNAVAANQAPSVSLTAPANGSSFTAGANVTVSASASDTDGTISKVDFYAGTTLIGSDTSSPYSVSWSNLPAGSFTLTAVATDNAGGTTTSAGRSVTIAAASGGGGTTQPGALPSGWTTADIGAPVLAGSASQANGTYTLQGAGRDIWDTSDQFRFAYRTVTGDVDVIARVTGITNTDPWAKAGLMIRGALSGGSVNALVYASAGAGVSYQRRVVANDMTTPVNQSGAAPIWLKLSRRGTQVLAYRSTDGVNWTLMTSETISLPSTIYVGLAVTSHNEAAVATGTFTNVTVDTAPPPVTTPPPPSGPTKAAFTPSADHSTLVQRYVLEVFAAGANPATATPLRTQDLGKPAVVNGECTADISTTLQQLGSGNYIATVSAVGAGGSSRSAAASFSK